MTLRGTGMASLGFAALAGAVLLTHGCGQVEDPWPRKPGPRVLTTIPPLACFAANVAGEDASVLCLLNSIGPHDYKPTPRDAFKLHRAHLFLINGLNLDDDIAAGMRKNSSNTSLHFVEVGEIIPRNQLREVRGGIRHGDHVHAGAFDPHVWLGIPEAILMVGCIRDQLKELDPAHAAGYTERAGRYIERLRQLHADGQESLKGKADRQLITFHDALFYFGRSFDLNIVGSIEPRAGEEPDAARLLSLVKLCKERNVRVIAVEPQYSGKTSARTLLEEIKSKGVADPVFVELDPMETCQPQDMLPGAIGLYYEQKVRDNIDQLKRNLR